MRSAGKSDRLNLDRKSNSSRVDLILSFAPLRYRHGPSFSVVKVYPALRFNIQILSFFSITVSFWQVNFFGHNIKII